MSRKQKQRRRSQARRRASETAGGGQAGPQQAKAERKAGAERPRRTAYDSIRENVEALVVAIILAIVIRHFAVEAFEIPTGSMAPTLNGMHVWTECPNCATEYKIAVSTDSRTGRLKTDFSQRLVYTGPCTNPKCSMENHLWAPSGRRIMPGGRIQCQSCLTEFRGERDRFRRIEAAEFRGARCPICHHRYSAVVEKSAIRNGNKILVNKFAYCLGEPQRWDIIVFEFDQWKNYIKRLVGLPGETIHIFDGDIYVDGKIVQKSLHPYIQGVLWQRISDSDVEERGLSATPPWLEPQRQGNDSWTSKRGGTRWSISHLNREAPAILEYQRGFDNYLDYNLGRNEGRGRPLEIQVGDKKVSFRVVPMAGEGWLGAEIRDGSFTFRATIPIGEPSADRPATLERLVNETGSERLPVKSPHPSAMNARSAYALPLNVPSEIEFENVDDRVALRLDGKDVLALSYVSCPDVSDPSAPNGRLPQYLRILGSDVEATLESIRVDQDLYYLDPLEASLNGSTPPIWGRSGIKLEEGQYLALGDNSASSSDGRFWGYVPKKNLMGKALLVFWPAWPLDFQCKFIR